MSECETCGSSLDEHGYSLSGGCAYSSNACDDCGACYCDGSC